MLVLFLLNEALNYAIRLTKGPNYVSRSSNHFLPSVIKRRASPYASRKIVFYAGETVMILSWFQQQQNHRYWLVDRKLHKQALQQNGVLDLKKPRLCFMVHYQQAISALDQEIATLQNNYFTVKQTWAESLSGGTPVLSLGHLKTEMHSITRLIENRNQIRGGLRQIVFAPQRLPLAKLLIAQKILPDEIKEQLR